MHDTRNNTWLSGTALHRMSLPRRRNAIREDRHSLATVNVLPEVTNLMGALTTPSYKTSNRGLTSLS